MDIEELQFGILSPEDVLALSVCEIKYEKQKKNGDLDNTLYDPRLGPIEDEKTCPTCKNTVSDCPGHFGHIILNSHIIYPLTYGFKTVLNMLKCFCFNCSRLAFTDAKLDLLGLSEYKGIKRYLQIVEASNKIEICWNCEAQMAKFYILNQNSDPKIMMYYKLLTEKKSKENSIEVTVSKIEEVFQGIIDEDLILLGFDPRHTRPKNLILSIIPVLPLCSRPFVMTNGEKCEDDLTTLYRDIGKANAHILTATKDEDRLKEIRSLSFYISVLMNNSKGRVKQPNGRAKKAISERLAAKDGLFRGNLMGKRVNYSARTVVGGDPTLAADQIAIPDCIATRVTIPDIVRSYNIDKLSQLVNDGQAEFVLRKDIETGQIRRYRVAIALKTMGTILYHGDTVFRKVNGIEQSVKIGDVSLLQQGDKIIRKGTGEVVIAELSRKRSFKLQIGDEVRRHLQDDDWVIINRQPTLHVGSMLAVRVKRQPHRRSIGTPLNDSTPLNMDYDGDEVNIHVPQTLEAKAEYMGLISVKNNIISGQARPIMGIVQDSLIACYKMTQGWVFIEMRTFNDICVAANLDLTKLDHVSRIYKELYGDTKYLYTGRGLLSLALPITFNYSITNKANETEPIFKIRSGVITEGTIDKSVVGPKNGAIHHYMSQSDGLDFLTKIQHIANNWIQGEGFSVGIQDCLPTVYDQNGMIPQVRDHIEQCYLKAHIAETTQTSPVIAEMKITAALNAARDVGQKLAKECLDKNNRFLPLILSGSKGSLANLTQITALLGQQDIAGKRLDLSCLDEKRSFPHFQEDESDLSQRYKSRGFVKRSFINGLDPHEFWAHAASSRIGIISTACTTAKVGYLQRRITEMLKNLSVKYDHTVRNADGRIIQFVYGSDGLAPYKQHRIDGTLQCFLGTRIEEISTKYEMEAYAKGQKLDIFRAENQLTLDIPDKSQDTLVSPIQSGGSESNSPDSFGTPPSADGFDYDD